jgi:transcriptional regulator with XRE-family HTH domain
MESSTYGATMPGLMAKKARTPLGKLLWKLRHDHELTLEDITDKTGVARSTLSKAENGHTDPDRATLDKLAALYKIPCGAGAIHAMAMGTPPVSTPSQRSGVSDAAVGVFAIDAAAFSELQDLAARLHRLVGIIEGRATRSAPPVAPSPPAAERGASGSRRR